jgi:hypothetical protein
MKKETENFLMSEIKRLERAIDVFQKRGDMALDRVIALEKENYKLSTALLNHVHVPNGKVAITMKISESALLGRKK